MQIDQTERHIIETRGSKNTLMIRKVHSQDFGNYTCAADNQLGKTKKTITLTGKPNVATFRSAPVSQWKDRYNISWIVESYTPIEEYRLYYKAYFTDIDNLDKNNPLYGSRKTYSTVRKFIKYNKINNYLQKPFSQ